MKKGTANGNFRMDGVRKWEISIATHKTGLEKPCKDATKEKLTDQIVNDFMGGSRAAEYQANAYKELFDEIRSGKKTGSSTQKSMADIARERMIERQERRGYDDNGGYPDLGRDQANRRAYPKESGSKNRKDSTERMERQIEARERAVAWANAGSK